MEFSGKPRVLESSSVSGDGRGKGQLVIVERYWLTYTCQVPEADRGKLLGKAKVYFANLKGHYNCHVSSRRSVKIIRLTMAPG